MAKSAIADTAEAGEPGLTRSFDLWLGVLGRKWGVELPSIREYEEVSAVLLHRLAERRFGPAAAERLSAVLAGVTVAGRLAEAGEWIVDCTTTADFLARVSRAGL